jgi:GNAT superfamily N-acetyltransferase
VPAVSTPTDDVVFREVLDPSDPILPSARSLYESVLDESERIPWEWLERTPERRRQWQPGQWRSHLVVATPRAAEGRAIGFAYGAFIPGYGGYICYLGVDPSVRSRSTGTKLFQFVMDLIADAARSSNLSLPFIIWESHPTGDRAIWESRIRLFDKVGGLWARGIEMLTPNYMQPDAGPVPLQIFLRPWDDCRETFDAERIRNAVRDLYKNIYRIPPEVPMHSSTMQAAVNPRLVPAVEALEEASK